MQRIFSRAVIPQTSTVFAWKEGEHASMRIYTRVCMCALASVHTHRQTGSRLFSVAQTRVRPH